MAEHYFTKKPQSKLKTTAVRYSYDGVTLDFLCASGVFSSRGVDFATSLLLHHARVEDGWDVLDLGCGVGIIGISIKKTHPQCNVVMTDVNERALQMVEKNAEKNNVKVEAFASDVYGSLEGREFDAIITNPPHHAGRDIVYAMIEGAKDHLKQGGFLQLVASHNKGGKMLEKKMRDIFGNMEFLVKKGGFRVYCSRKE